MAAQLHLWRRSYASRPPELAADDDRHPARECKYAAVPPAQLPRAESLADTVARVLPVWHERIEPVLMQGQSPLVYDFDHALRYLGEQDTLGTMERDAAG